VSLAEANAAAPALNLEKMLTALAGKKPSTVLLDIPSFWPKYSEVIAKTPKAAIHGLLAFKAAAALVGHVESSELRKLFPASTSKERGLDCVDSLTDFMASELVDSYFIRAAYNEQSLKAVDKMATNVIAAFKKRVGELEWLGAESRKRAVKKVENIVRNIGHRTDEAANPDPMSGESLATYYRDLNITTGSHFANSLGGMRVKTAKAFAQVDLPIDRKSFLLPVSGPNAAYYMAANSINIPAGSTQLPAFHHQLPSYALYGGVGSIIGHEITHGFDSNGRKWDENAAHSKWWDDESSNKFDDLSQCFIEQYNAYEVDVPSGKANVNGNITLAENISDAGGLRAAYEAWLAERKAMPSAWDQDLPGLDMFTHEQLFFIMWGNNWCSSYSAAGMEDLIKTDNHAPATARLGLTAQNSGAFKEAFKCKNKKPACEIF
jgi:endothelin-converting enzyme